MKSLAILVGALYGLTAVGIGAFGAHAWESILQANGYQTVFDTASRYHFYHSLFLLFLGIAAERSQAGKWIRASVICVITGVFIFSGSLYLLSLLNIKALGMVTPIGGLLLMAGWATMFAHFWSIRKST